MTARRKATWPSAADGLPRPSAAARASSVPCHSGESPVSGRTHDGSRSIGKNVPENGIIGISTRRNSTLNDAPSSSTRAVKAVTAAPTAAAVSSAATSAAMMPGEVTPPNTAMMTT